MATSAITTSMDRPSTTTETSPKFRDQPLGRFLRKLFRICASLQLAISLLSLFTICLILATLLESAYSAEVARDLVYRTWWFTGLLTLLGINVLCAALKKYPWKRYQTGFLVTHLGLITLVFGGLLTNIGGSEGQMNLVDTENPEIHQYFHVSNKSDTIQVTGEHQIEICRVPKDAYNDQALLEGITNAFYQGQEASDELKEKLKGHYWTVNFWPGSLAWHDDKHYQSELSGVVSFLKTLANPFPGLEQKCDDTVSLKVENFYPHTTSQPFRAAEGQEQSFPALHLKMTTPMTKRPNKRWITSLPDFLPDPMPIRFEMFVLNDSLLLSEFLNPPTTKEMGKKGQLTLILGEDRTRHHVQLDNVKVGEAIDLGKTSFKFKLRHVGNLMNMMTQGHGHGGAGPKDGPFYPAVQFELLTADGKKKGVYLASARMPQMPTFQSGDDVTIVSSWYHYPDFRWGDESKMGSLQFLRSPDGKLYYRVFGKEGLKGKGQPLDTTDKSKRHKLPWGQMNMEFQVLEWISKATKKEQIEPIHVTPGAKIAERTQPALRCQLSNEGNQKEFFVRMSRQAAKVIVGKNVFFVRYRQASRRVNFTLKLKKAQQTNDPGTNRAAAYESDVVLGYEENGEQIEREQKIYMNHTLDHGKYKVYQTQYQPLMHPQTLRIVVDEKDHLVSLSGLTIAYDPGLWAKYLGSGLLVLGIAIMFYMRAYFFKRK